MFPRRFMVRKRAFEIVIFNNSITMDYRLSLIVKLVHLKKSGWRKESNFTSPIEIVGNLI